ncbi:hypothetical protein [Halospeciosus flavus]|uniref:PKD domain-containing protein n=2 Tax=Halospeciosus flavus TaxID=3032283 RepID=A0ABD5Z0H2_9EURY
MRLRDDERGQAVQVGFVLVLLVVLTAFSGYQAFVVPEQNAQVEFQHTQSVEESMRHLRDRVYLAGATGGTQSLTVDLGPNYPPRLFAMNPPTPTGRLHTRAAGSLSLTVDGGTANLSAACGYGNGSVPSRSLAYEVDYNARPAAPTLAYSHGAVYEHAGGAYVLLDEHQSLVTNHTLSLYPLATPYTRASSGPVTVELVPGPVGRTTVEVNSTATLVVPTRLPAEQWTTLLSDQPTVRDVVQRSDTSVGVVLEPGNYTVACAPVGLDDAPPTGPRALGTLPTGEPTEQTNQTTNETTQEPTGDHRPNATIENVTATRDRSGSTFHNDVTVEWSASDVDGDLDAVTVRVTDLNTSETHSTSLNVSGSSASGTFSATFGKDRKDEGTTYRVTLTVVDERGHQIRKEKRVTIE